MDFKTSIRRFIQDEVLFGDKAVAVTDDTLLWEGIIDSIGLMDLVAFLESEFGIQIRDEDLTAQNFRTIADIEQLVSNRIVQR